MRTRVVSNSNIKGPYYKIILSPPCKIEALPGQFLMIRSGSDPCPSDPLLSRPFSIHRINPDNNIEVLYKVVGKGTALLSNVDKGDEVDITGPLGNGFGRVFSDEIIIIAGGIGIAPMVGLIEDIRGRDPQKKIIVFLGGRGEEDLLCVDGLKAIATELILTTNDGSVGLKGYVTDALAQRLSLINHHSLLITSIYACGPTAMLQRISEIIEPLNITAWFSLESNMACGIGICMGCAVKKRGGGYFLVCKDGPVFKREALDL